MNKDPTEAEDEAKEPSHSAKEPRSGPRKALAA